MDRLEELKRALEVAYQEGRQDDVLILAREIDRLEKGATPEAAPGIPTVEGGEIKGATGPSPSLIPKDFSVGNALTGLRNMGVPDETVSAIQALLSVSTGGLVEMPPEAVAAAETLLTLGTGAVGGTAGMLGGTAAEAGAQASRGQFGTPQAAQAIQEAAMRGAERLTYSPRTEMGRRLLGQVAEASEPLAQLPPVLPTAGLPGAAAATLPQRARMAQAALPERRGAAPEVPTAQPAAPVPLGQREPTPARIVPGEGRREPVVAEAVDVVEEVSQAGPDSVGAARAPVEAVRRETAAQLPVPFVGKSGLTKGQATRDANQLAFESETAKLNELGDPFRERYANQTATFIQNFDALIDINSPITRTAREVGASVDEAVRTRAEVQRKKIREAYEAARAQGDLEAPVNLQGLANALDEVRAAEGVSPNIKATRQEARRLGMIDELDSGELVGLEATINDAETLRQFINKVTNWTDRRESNFAKGLILAIDRATDGLGGDLYKQARSLRARYADEFENVGLTAKLLGTKGKTSERAIALQDVFDKVIRLSSIEEMNKVRKTLLNAGPKGKQAWFDLKAAAMRYIRDNSLMETTDSSGQRVISSAKLNKAIRDWDDAGKLEALFGKRGAQTIRDLGEMAQTILTLPPGVGNPSGTKAAFFNAMIELPAAGISGLPVGSRRLLMESLQYVKNRELRKRIRDALKEPNE